MTRRSELCHTYWVTSHMWMSSVTHMIHTHTHTHTHAYKHTHTHTHTRKHTHANTHTNTHTRTHTYGWVTSHICPYVWHWGVSYVTHTCTGCVSDVLHSYVWFDSFMCVTYVRHDSCTCVPQTFKSPAHMCVTWRIWCGQKRERERGINKKREKERKSERNRVRHYIRVHIHHNI